MTSSHNGYPASRLTLIGDGAGDSAVPDLLRRTAVSIVEREIEPLDILDLGFVKGQGGQWVANLHYSPGGRVDETGDSREVSSTDQFEDVPAAEILGDLMVASLPQGWQPCGAEILIKCIDDEGVPLWAFRGVGVESEELLGALTVRLEIARRRAVAFYE